MEDDCDDGFPFEFEPNLIAFGLKSKGKLSPQRYSIQFLFSVSQKKWKTNRNLFFGFTYHIIMENCNPKND